MNGFEKRVNPSGLVPPPARSSHRALPPPGGWPRPSAGAFLFYRDEVYCPDSSENDKAEIIVANKRNGPTGHVPLTFRCDFTRFDNYANPKS